MPSSSSFPGLPKRWRLLRRSKEGENWREVSKKKKLHHSTW